MRSSSRCALRTDGTSGLATRQIVSARVERRHGARVHLRAGVDDDVLVLAAEQPEHLFEAAAVARAGPIEEIRAGEDLEPGLVLDHELLQELLVEPMQVVERVEHRVAAAHAEEQRHLTQARP